MHLHPYQFTTISWTLRTLHDKSFWHKLQPQFLRPSNSNFHGIQQLWFYQRRSYSKCHFSWFSIYDLRSQLAICRPTYQQMLNDTLVCFEEITVLSVGLQRESWRMHSKEFEGCCPGLDQYSSTTTPPLESTMASLLSWSAEFVSVLIHLSTLLSHWF